MGEGELGTENRSDSEWKWISGHMPIYLRQLACIPWKFCKNFFVFSKSSQFALAILNSAPFLFAWEVPIHNKKAYGHLLT
jgi:hypothetical protein